MVNVYDDDNHVIARVKYNNNLDRWDGQHWTSGGALGIHKGLTRLKNGRFVLIHGTQWKGDQEGVRDTAKIISEEEAVQEILKSGNDELFDKYPTLAHLRKDPLIEEE